jgi:acyl-CoA synthetase (AMP-forming)/AMP-acid ligase II
VPRQPADEGPKLAGLTEDCAPAALIGSGNHAPLLLAAASQRPLPSLVIVAGADLAAPLRGQPGVVAWNDAIASESSDTPPPRTTIDIDLASLIYTSGSTGTPKGIMLTHRNMLTAATSITTYLENREDDVILCALPLSFDYGLYQIIMAFRVGARVVLERSFAYPTQVLEDMVAERVTGFPGVPTMFATLAGMKGLDKYDFSRIRYVTNTAAAIAAKHIAFVRQTFQAARFYSMYGLTECKRCTFLPPEDLDRKPDSVGIAIPNTELWIVDDDGNRVGPNIVGQLVIRGATVMKGYWNKPEETARRLRPGPLPGGASALHGRLLPAGRGRVPVFRFADGRHHQDARREGGAQGSRSGAARHPGDPRGRRCGDPGCDAGRGDQGVRGAPRWRDADGERHHVRVPEASRAAHGAGRSSDGVGVAANHIDEDQQAGHLVNAQAFAPNDPLKEWSSAS